jgi:hypothetical protein
VPHDRGDPDAQQRDQSTVEHRAEVGPQRGAIDRQRAKTLPDKMIRLAATDKSTPTAPPISAISVLTPAFAESTRHRCGSAASVVLIIKVSYSGASASTASTTIAKRLVAIGETARSALTEMRRLLGVLREDAGTAPSRVPQPGLEQLNELIDEARDSAGASTRLVVRGRVAPLDPGIELTAYRIVQEALTNARRHAPGSAVDVELHYAQDVLRLRVRDNGPGPGSAVDSGHGLVGMRERAAMVGGTMSAGPARHGGFLVEVVLPVAEDVQ